MAGDIRIGRLTIAPASPVVWIFECGINFNGSMELAHKLVEAAAEAGADIFKTQVHRPAAEMVGPEHPLWDVLSEAALCIEQLAELKRHTEELGMEFLATPFSFQAVDDLETLGVKGWKMGSGELNNIPLQRYVARKRLPMIISTGMSSLEEVAATVKEVRPFNRDLVLLNCCSCYPSSFYQARLARLDLLRDICPLVGASDHTATISTALGAIARGAVVIEKHCTLDRSLPGPDHAASILPNEFAQMVRMGPEIWQALQAGAEEVEGVLPEELPVRAWANHSLVTARSLRAGAVLTEADLTTKRPSGAVPAAQVDAVLGKLVLRDLPSGAPLDWSDLAPG